VATLLKELRVLTAKKFYWISAARLLKYL
jgi:hypothetical protein